jgi:hypothetical protein
LFRDGPVGALTPTGQSAAGNLVSDPASARTAPGSEPLVPPSIISERGDPPATATEYSAPNTHAATEARARPVTVRMGEWNYL